MVKCVLRNLHNMKERTHILNMTMSLKVDHEAYLRVLLRIHNGDLPQNLQHTADLELKRGSEVNPQ